MIRRCYTKEWLGICDGISLFDHGYDARFIIVNQILMQIHVLDSLFFLLSKRFSVFSIFYYFSSCPIPRSTLQFDSVWVSTIIKMELPSVACTWLLLNSLMSCHRHQGSCLKILSYILLSTLRYRKTSSVAIFNILISANRLGRKTLYFLWSNGVFTCCYTWSFLLWIY